MSQPRVTIIGAGRMGQGLGLALKRRGYKVILVNRTQREVTPPLVLHQGSLAEATDGAELVLIATPDDAIPQVAAELASARAIARDQVVLHLSGLLDKSALSRLEETGAGLGSFHPLQSVAEVGHRRRAAQGRLRRHRGRRSGSRGSRAAGQHAADDSGDDPGREQAGLSRRRRLRSELHRRPGRGRRAAGPLGRCASGNGGSAVSAPARWCSRQPDLPRPSSSR